MASYQAMSINNIFRMLEKKLQLNQNRFSKKVVKQDFFNDKIYTVFGLKRIEFYSYITL
jgi:hypothetical protein